jgi:hypothetical protein
MHGVCSERLGATAADAYAIWLAKATALLLASRQWLQQGVELNTIACCIQPNQTMPKQRYGWNACSRH